MGTQNYRSATSNIVFGCNYRNADRPIVREELGREEKFQQGAADVLDGVGHFGSTETLFGVGYVPHVPLDPPVLSTP